MASSLSPIKMAESCCALLRASCLQSRRNFSMVVEGGRSQDETGYDDIGYESIDVGGGGVLVGIVAVDGDGVAG